jgi:NAD(P)-dependent dehydrogenase (short-subunit alcohol dehydrogenase family)
MGQCARFRSENVMKIAQLFDVSGLVTVVTGAASGIGFACAEAMSDNGARVVLADMDANALDTAVEALKKRGGEVQGAVADVTNAAALRKAFDTVAAEHGRLDVVFANAGISGGPGFLKQDRTRNPERAIESVPEELIDRLLDVNYKSILLTIQAAVPHMKRGGGGRIVVTSTISTIKTETFVLPYVMSKAGIMQLVRQAALELAAYNIRVNAMAPGPFVTNIGSGRLQDPEAQEFFSRFNPMHRMGKPEDIQGLALFLASRASDHITGEQVVIDGGTTLGVAD